MSATFVMRTLASGVDARTLIMRPDRVQVDPGFRTLPTAAETKSAQVLAEARLAQQLVPVPGSQLLLPTPQLVEHDEFGQLDVFSERGLISLSSDSALMAPLFFLRPRSAELDEATLLVNSNYFLFLEPDLDGPWNAYGDPVGLVMAGGVIEFAPQLPRTSLLMSESKYNVQCVSFADLQITLSNNQPILAHPFGSPKYREPFVAFARCFGSVERFSPAGDDGYDVAYIGRFPVAGRQGALPIPRAGCVVRYPDRRTAFEFASQPLRYALDGQWGDCIQVGPQLLKRGALTNVTENIFMVEYMTENGQLPDNDTVSPAHWKADWDKTRAARLGAGVDEHGNVVMIAVEGTSSVTDVNEPVRGATLRDLALLMRDEGVVDGMHLDGGGSTQVFGQAGGALIQPSDVHHGLPHRLAQYDRPIPTWIRVTHV